MNPHHHPHLGQSYHGYGHSGTATPPHLPPPLSPYGGQPFPLHQQYPSGGQVQPGMGYPPHQYQTHSGMRQSTSGSMDLSGMDREESENEDSDESESEEEEESGKGTSAGQKRKRAEEGKGKGHSSTGGAQADSGSSGTKKPKPTRGSKACTNCRRLKMRCVGAENGPPCARCSHGGHECIFEESNRGKKSVKKTEAMAKSLRKMEQTLATVLRSIRDPGLAAQAGGMVTRSPSPDASSSEDRRGALSGLTDRGHKYSQERDRERRGWRMEAEVDEHGNALAFPLPPGTDNGSAIRSLVGSHRSTKDVGATTEAAVRESMRNLASPGGQTVDPNAFRMQAAEKRPPARNGAAGPSSGSGDPTTGTRFLEPMPHYSPRTSRSSGRRGGSPRLHSLPDNTLNPLGLLAEASLHNSHRVRRATARATSVSSTSAAGGKERSASVGSSASPGKAGASGVLKSEGGGEEEAGAQNGARAETTSAAAESAGGRAGSAGAPGGEARGASRPRMGVTGRGREPSVTKTRRDEEERVSLGVASETYFKPGPMTILPLRRIIIEREMPPELLTLGIVSSEEVLHLFRIFFHHCSQHMLLLDPDWHTPTFICSRSPFLFTCVCTVASKFYTTRPDLHPKCLALAKKVAFDVMSRGYKSVEIVQGFLLLSMWNQPAERFEEDKTWLFSGVAIRMATDLNLHRKSVASLPGNPHPDDPAVLDREREIINRERTWYICFIVDRSLSAQMGKPYSIREDWIIRNCRHWCMQRLSRPWDLGISALVELQRTHSRQLDFLYSSTTSVSGLNTEIDYPSVLRVFNEQLEEWKELWKYRGLFHIRARTGRPFSAIDPIPGSFPPAPEAAPGEPSSASAQEDAAPGAEARASESATMAEAQARDGKDTPKGKQPEPTSRDADETSTAGANASGSASTAPPTTSGADSTSRPPASASASEPAAQPWLEGSIGDEEDHNTRTMYYVIRQAPLRHNYAVLVLNSFGLQHSLDHPSRGGLDKAQYFAKCLQAAKGIIICARDGLKDVMRYAPDSQFVMVSYACVFLLKLVRPVFSNYVDEDSVLQLVSECADMLESVAVNETHTPALYASFIRALLAARQEQSVKSGNCTPYRYADGSRAASPAAAGMQAPDGLASRDPNDVQPGADGTANPADMHGMSATFSSDSITGIGMTASAAAAFGLPSDDANAGENGAGGSGGGGLEGASAFGMGPNGVNVDQLLTTSFWDSLLPPGFGGPLDGLSGSVDMHPSTYSMPGFSNHAHGEGSGTGGEGAEGGNGAGEGAGGNGAGSAHAHGHGHGHGHAHGHGMSLTPGATRAPSPQLMQSSFSGLDFSFPSGVLQP